MVWFDVTCREEDFSIKKIQKIFFRHEKTSILQIQVKTTGLLDSPRMSNDDSTFTPCGVNVIGEVLRCSREMISLAFCDELVTVQIVWSTREDLELSIGKKITTNGCTELE